MNTENERKGEVIPVCPSKFGILLTSGYPVLTRDPLTSLFSMGFIYIYCNKTLITYLTLKVYINRSLNIFACELFSVFSTRLVILEK